MGIVVVTAGFDSNDTATLKKSTDWVIDQLQTHGIKVHVVTTGIIPELVRTAKESSGSYFIGSTYDEVRNYFGGLLRDNIIGSCEEQLPVDASFTGNVLCADNPPLTVQFTLTNPVNDGDQYSWSFGDGSYSTQQSPSHIYTTAGQFTVILRVISENYGRVTTRYYSDIETKVDYIYVQDVPDLVAAFAADVTSGDNGMGTGLSVQFTNQSTGVYDSYFWDFGDGGTSTEANPLYIYFNEGTFTVSLTVTNSATVCGNAISDTETKVAYITVWECLFLTTLVDVYYTYIEKFPFSYDMLTGVILHKMQYKFSSDECMPPTICEIQSMPNDLKPIAIIDLKYTSITGSGKNFTPYKIGQELFWSESGFLSYEIVKNINGKGVKLCFNSEMAFTGPVDSQMLILPNVGPFTFNGSDNILGIEGPDFTIRLIEFSILNQTNLLINKEAVPQKFTDTQSYTASDVCDIINSAFEGEMISTVDKYGRVVIMASTKGNIRIVGEDQGSTANEKFGVPIYGALGVKRPDYGTIDYEVTLYIACYILDSDYDMRPGEVIKKLLGPYQILLGEFQVKSTNYFEVLYGNYPRVISNQIAALPGHRYIGHSPVVLDQIEESTDQPTLENSRFANTGFTDESVCVNTDITKALTNWNIDTAHAASLNTPYWKGMICENEGYPSWINLWCKGDDIRFYNKMRFNAAKNYLEVKCNYDFIAPPPVIRNELTAEKIGPYNLPLDPNKKRFLCLRRISLVGMTYGFTFTVGDRLSVTESYGTYDPDTQTLSIDVTLIENSENPKYTPIVTMIPTLQWSNSDEIVPIVGNWSGIGTSRLSCVMDIGTLPNDFSGENIDCTMWVSQGIDEISQADEWVYVELPFGNNVSATEIIKAMQRDGDWLAENNSNCHWTPSTSHLDSYGYLLFNTLGEGRIEYQFLDIDGKLRIRSSIDFDYRIRLGGTPEQCFANNIFGWNPLGELGDRVESPQGPYYTYTYITDMYVTKDLHPALGSNNLISYHSYSLYRYKLVYNADKYEMYDTSDEFLEDSAGWYDSATGQKMPPVTPLKIAEQYQWIQCGAHLVKCVYDRAKYLNLLYSLLQAYLLCENIGGINPNNTNPNNTNPNNLPPVDGDEYPFTIPACDDCITFTTLEIPVNCVITGDCDDLETYDTIPWNSLEVRSMMREWANDPFLSIILNEVNAALIDPDNYDRYVERLYALFTTILADEVDITDTTTTTTSSETEFSVSSISTELQTLRDSIIVNLRVNPLRMAVDMGIFAIRYVEAYNSTGETNGISFIKKKFSTLDSTFYKFTIAKYSLFTYSREVVATNIDIENCMETLNLTCDVNIMHTIYPVLLDMYTGEEILPESIKIDFCYCNYNYDGSSNLNQITVCLPTDAKRRNPVIGILKKVEYPDIYLSKIVTLDLIDTTGMPVYEHIIAWESDAMPMGFEPNSDSTGLGDPSLLKSVEWKPHDEEMTITLCPAAVEQDEVRSAELDDCIPLPHDLTYVFSSTAFTGTRSLTLTGTQIMRDDFIIELTSTLQPLTVELEGNEIVIGSDGDSVTVVVPVGDPFGFTNEEIVPQQSEMDLTIYYTYIKKESTEIPQDVYISG